MSTPVEVLFRWRGEEGNRAIQETGQIVDRVTGLVRGLGREADSALQRVNRLSRDTARTSRDYTDNVQRDTKTRITSYEEEMTMLGQLERARNRVFRGDPQGEYADVRAAGGRGDLAARAAFLSRYTLNTDPAAIVAGPGAQTEGAMLAKFNAAARSLNDTEGAVKRVSAAATEGTRNVSGLAGIFTATTENGRKMRAVLYDIANQAGLPGVSRGLGVFGGAPTALIAGFVFLELARGINSASEEYRKLNEEQLQFETNMANFGRRGGTRQLTSELEKLTEVRRAMIEVASLGEDPTRQLEAAGLRRPGEQRSGIIQFLQRTGIFGDIEGQATQRDFGTVLARIAASPFGLLGRGVDFLSSGFFSAPGTQASGIKNLQELEQQLRGGYQRFQELQQINERAGRETIFSKARESLGLDAEKQNDELTQLSVKLGALEGQYKSGQISLQRYKQEFTLLGEAGRVTVDQLARQKLAQLNQAFGTREFTDEAIAFGVTPAQLYAEKFANIQKEVQAAKHQLEEFNREGERFNQLQKQREEFRTSTFKAVSGAFNQITAEQLPGNAFLGIFDKFESRMAEFRNRFGGLGADVTGEYEKIARGIKDQDEFRAELSGRERINALLIQADELRNNEQVFNAKRNKDAQEYLNVMRQTVDYQRQIDALRTGQPTSALQQGADVRNMVDSILASGLTGRAQDEAILEATRGMSRQQLQAANVLIPVQEALADLSFRARDELVFKRKTPEQRAAEESLKELSRGFDNTVQGRAKESAALDAFLQRSALPFDQLTDELREARIKASERRAELEAKSKEDALEVEKQRNAIEALLSKAINDFLEKNKEPQQFLLRVETDDGKERTELLKAAGK